MRDIASPAERRSWRRRTFLKSCGAAAAAAFAVPAARAAAAEPEFRPFAEYAEVPATLRRRRHELRILGSAPDGSPLVAVRCGGKKLPAIFISGGAHSTEHAGALATVEVVDRLETEHVVWVVPARDPVGLGGFRHALTLGLGRPPKLESADDVDDFLRTHGEVLVDADGIVLTLIGEHGYANQNLLQKIAKGSPPLEPLRGRRIWCASRRTDTPGSGPLERAYTLIVSPEGEVLHLNRFHDTRWAPAEVRAVRTLMAEIKPALTFDLHEHDHGPFFWMSARKQRTEDDEIWERRMATEAARAVAATGSDLAPDSYSPGSFFERLERGVFWLDPGKRGEGLNLVDLAARHYGPGFTIETGMQCPFDERVNQHLRVVETAVRVFERRYA